MNKKKNAVMIADTRPALVGHILLQLQETNKGLFDEAIIYYTELSGNDMGIMNSIMPCRFIKYSPALPDELLEKERFKMFSVIMFARYEMFKYLQEFETITWIDTDILIQGKLDGLIKEADQTGFALIREDYENKTAKEPDHMRTCFTEAISGYNMEAYLYCSGTVVLTDKLIIKSDYTEWCYKKTVEWCDILSLPDQGVLNALVQEFGLSVSPLNGSKYCCFPYYGRDCSQAKIVHAWGVNKFWNDWYLYCRFTTWKEIYKNWLALGGTPLLAEICPKISVLIPVYKPNIDSFKQCIDSLIYQYSDNGQRFSDFEIIIVSEPFCQKEINDFIISYNDSRIRLVFNESRLGIAASLNKAMRLAIGKYIARIDDDDIANDHRLVKQVKYLDSHENIILCTTDFNYFGDMNQKRISFDGEMSRAWSIFTCPFDHPTIMYRKQFFLDNNLFYDETRGYVEDWELWLRAFDKGMTVGCIHEVLFYHRWRNGSAGQAGKTIEMMRDLIQNNFGKLGVEISKEDLAFVGPWNGKTSESESERLQELFDQTLKNNAIRKLYDQKCLLKIFSLRMKEAKTGVLPEIWMPLTVGEPSPQQSGEWKPEQPGMFKRVLKKLLKPLYQPVRHRFEDRIINIERMTSELQAGIRNIQPIISSLKQQQDDLAYSIQELHWIIHSDLQSVQESFNTDLQNAQESLNTDLQSVQESFNTDLQNAQESLNTDLQSAQESLNTDLQNAQESLNTDLQNAIITKTLEIHGELDNRIDDLIQLQNNTNNNLNDLSNRILDETHRHIDFTYRDVMVVLENTLHFVKHPQIALITEHPLALESNDYKVPHGTIRDNTRYPRFIRKCEQIFPVNEQLKFLDLGCSGGGMVLDAVLRGHIGIGLEGSDMSLVQQRAEWRLLKDNLFTCDIVYPFELKEKETGLTMQFDVITAWEVMEHLSESSLPQLFINLQTHLSDDGVFVASISNWDDIDPITGVNWHVNTKPYEWWTSKFEENGFCVCEDLISSYDIARGGINPPQCFERPYDEFNVKKTFHIVVKKLSR